MVDDLTGLATLCELQKKQLAHAMKQIASQHKTITALRRDLDGKRTQIAMLSRKIEVRREKQQR